MAGDRDAKIPGSSDDRSELDRAVERCEEARGPEQPALFEEADSAVVPAVRSKGRPLGSRNLRSEAYAALLIREAGADPLAVAARVAAKDVLDEEVVKALALTWGCTQFDAVKLWATINRDVQPYLHQQLPRAIVLPPGAPGGERIIVAIDGEFHQVATAGRGDDQDDDNEEEAA